MHKQIDTRECFIFARPDTFNVYLLSLLKYCTEFTQILKEIPSELESRTIKKAIV